MTRVLGSELRVGMAFSKRFGGSFPAVITYIEKYTIPAKVLHSYYAEKFPKGMPGAIVHTQPPMYSQTVFNDEYYEVGV